MEIIGLFSFFAVIFFTITSVSPVIRTKISSNFTIKKSLLFGLISFIVLTIAFNATETSSDSVESIASATNKPTAEVKEVAEVKLANTESTTNPTVKPTATVKPTTTPEPTIKETVGQKNAISKAKDYLDYTAFSRSGLIDQLKFEGFDKEDAEYAVDKLEVDWNQQAYLKAIDYLDYTSFSKQGLIDQLKYEGFTSEQAKYGADEAYK